jgi:hypothetical protein
VRWLGEPHSNWKSPASSRRWAMKTSTTASIYGLVPVPSILEMQALSDEDQLPIADDANVALLAWYRHLQTERLAVKETDVVSSAPSTVQGTSAGGAYRDYTARCCRLECRKSSYGPNGDHDPSISRKQGFCWSSSLIFTRSTRRCARARHGVSE